jgi:hypothetical protein
MSASEHAMLVRINQMQPGCRRPMNRYLRTSVDDLKQSDILDAVSSSYYTSVAGPQDHLLIVPFSVCMINAADTTIC